MRIVAGRFRGRRLEAPPGQATRPTADRVRQALFDVLTHSRWARPFEGLRVADLFAGSGALGLEALSRGADSCLFVERAAPARAAIAANAAALELMDRVRLDARDATRLGARPGEAPFDLVFLDPPYGEDLAGPALAGLVEGRWLAARALLAVEQREGEPPLEPPPGLSTIDVRAWGPARLTFVGAP